MKNFLKITTALLFVSVLFLSIGVNNQSTDSMSLFQVEIGTDVDAQQRLIDYALAENCNSWQSCQTGMDTERNDKGNFACCTQWTGTTTGHKEKLVAVELRN